MSDRPSTETPTPAQLTDQELDGAVGGLVPAVAPQSSIIAVAPAASSSQPVLPAVQRGLIGLL